MKLRWYYRKSDLAEARLDSNMKMFFSTMSADEFILSDHYTINDKDAIFGHSRMVHFETGKVNLVPLGHNDTFHRGCSTSIVRFKMTLTLVSYALLFRMFTS